MFSGEEAVKNHFLKTEMEKKEGLNEISEFIGKSEKNNGRESAVNRALDGSTYPGKSSCPLLFAKKIVSCMKCNNLYLGLVTPSNG
jgi:hypothetical protein